MYHRASRCLSLRAVLFSFGSAEYRYTGWFDASILYDASVISEAFGMGCQLDHCIKAFHFCLLKEEVSLQSLKASAPFFSAFQ